MPYTYRVVFLLLYVVSTTMPNKGTINLDSLKSESPKKGIANEDLKKTSQGKENPEILSEDEIAKMELVFKNSPEEAQQIVNDLENPTYSGNKNDKFVIFFGDSQSDSKAMTEAITYKMYKQGWNCKFLSSESFFGKNDDIQNLHKELKRTIIENIIEFPSNS